MARTSGPATAGRPGQDEDREQRIAALRIRLRETAGQIRSAQDWARYLQAAARLRGETWANVLLVSSRIPDATLVRGYEAWRAAGRQVNRDEKGIEIFSALHRQQPDGRDAEERGQDHSWRDARRVAYVWDLSQTTGHHSARPALGSGSTTPGTGPSSPGPSRAASGAAGATPSPSGKPTPAPSSSATHHAAAAGTCSAASLVVSLTSARYSYPAHVRPQFDVSVVSTARGRCTAALGAAHLHVRIRAGGKARVWDSADCARPAAAARVTRLARGVPVVVQFSWNRTTSAPGCRSPHRAVRPGTYTATAYSGHRSSPAMTFVLKGRGTAVP